MILIFEARSVFSKIARYRRHSHRHFHKHRNSINSSCSDEILDGFIKGTAGFVHGFVGFTKDTNFLKSCNNHLVSILEYLGFTNFSKIIEDFKIEAVVNG